MGDDFCQENGIAENCHLEDGVFPRGILVLLRLSRGELGRCENAGSINGVSRKNFST